LCKYREDFGTEDTNMARCCAIVVVTLVSAICLEPYAFGEIVGDSFVFVKDNRPAATLVVGSKAKVEDDLHFANILAGTIKQISAVEIPVADAKDKVPGRRQVLIGTPQSIPLLVRLLTEDTVYRDKTGCEMLPRELGEQGFVIHKTKHEDKEYLILSGRTNLAVLYAVNTLEDRLHTEADQVIVDGFGTRLMPIVNTPAFRYRSLQTAVGGPDFLGSGQYMREFGYNHKAFVDWLASHKINNILLHDTGFTWGICYDSKRFPELVNRDHPNVKRDYLGGIIRYGRKRGLTVFFAHNIPDRWHFIVKVYPELAGTINAEGVPSNNVVCLNKPRVMQIWRDYWDEALDRYPGVEAIGCQFGEGISPRLRCQCDVCRSDQYYKKQLEFFDAMVEAARSRRHPVKYWIWRVPGAKDIIERKKDYPDLVDIDWRLNFRPFMLGRRTEGDWYLYHRHGNNPEFGMKQMCMAMENLGLEGLQIRAVQFREKDKLFQHFEEFTWNPQLSIADYAHLYAIKVLRRKDEKLADAYAHYIRAQGYSEIYAEDRRRMRKRELSEQEKRELDSWRNRAAEEKQALSSTLEEISVNSDFVEWLRRQAK
jgi:hypothetical protein